MKWVTDQEICRKKLEEAGFVHDRDFVVMADVKDVGNLLMSHLPQLLVVGQSANEVEEMVVRFRRQNSRLVIVGFTNNSSFDKGCFDLLEDKGVGANYCGGIVGIVSTFEVYRFRFFGD